MLLVEFVVVVEVVVQAVVAVVIDSYSWKEYPPWNSCEPFSLWVGSL